MKSSKFLLLLLAITVQAPAATIVYTDSHHSPSNVTSGRVVYLDAPDTVQRQLFGELPADPVQAAQVAKSIIQSPNWQQKQQQIGQAYQGVLQAYSLKLAKYPAVVFDDRYVVYGTADVAVAEARLAEFQGAR
ncbi:TIGR03757 family integrating conjugative element protein [Raoultella terrigena]|uniref:TIGR03757 family integrating conjugative element protein n=1 Tax=Raoultella terrigena TaxID=577 RepID=UPI0005F7E1D2|nr:TIGR03757 family integrating conjugative element protein [Raoultella terrigena]